MYYAEVEADAEYATITFNEGRFEPRVVGRRPSDFGPTLLGDVQAGRTLVVEDAATDVRLEPHERTVHQALGVSATLAYPLLKARRLVGLLVAHSGSKRTWEALERSRSETAVRLSETRLRSTLDRRPASVWVSDPNGNVELINQRWYEYSSATPDQVTTALTAEEWVHPEEASRVMAAFAQAVSNCRPFEIEQRNRAANGEWRWFLGAKSG